MNSDIAPIAAMRDVIEAISASTNLVITGHRTPDGDAIGAVYALGMALRSIGKDVRVVLEEYNGRFSVIPGRELLYGGEPHELEPDTFFALDCGSVERMGAAVCLLKKARCTVNIDHHVSNTMFAQINHVDSLASSTCEIVFRILNELDSACVFNKDIASALYAGIIYDTGGLRHNSTTLATMDAARRLMEFDIPFTRIYNELMHMRTLTEIKAMDRALKNLYLLEDGAIACTYITCDDLNETGAIIADLGDICEYVVNIAGVQLATFIYQRLDGKGCKVSMRSKKIPINGIAQHLGGGGHSLAAGSDFGGTLEQAQQVVTGMLRELLWTE
ncbi:MAG: bifunctional oligoribonuclease/PAP phosphatase NrnA [Defluviitaleaceae bacterium]|nr:bifunctional oligoribonuclease/PAP phosphatase NrnA [Defluviitaleaceae bacterium]